MRQSAKWSNTEQPGSSITSGTRQSVREGDSRPIWSRFLPDVSRKVTRGIGQNKVRNVLLQQFQAFQRDSDAESKSRLEAAGKQAFNIFISVDGEAKALDTTSSRKDIQRSRKRHHAFFRSVGDCLELLPTRNEYFFYSGSKSRLGFRETQALSRMFACESEAHFAAKDLGLCSRRAPLEAGSSVQRISARSWRRLARALRVTQVERTTFVERKSVLEIGAA